MDHPDEITLIFKNKAKAYGEFLSATLLLKKALETERMAEAAELIERREKMIRVVDDLDREIGHLRKNNPHMQDDEVMRKGAAVSSALIAKIQEMILADRDCRALIAERLSQVRRELVIIHEKEKGLQGYNGRLHKIPKFLSIET